MMKGAEGRSVYPKQGANITELFASFKRNNDDRC